MKENKQWNSAQIQTWCWYLYTQYAQNILTCALQHRSSQKHTLFVNTVSQADRYSPVFLTILWPSPVRSDWPIKCHCLMSSTSESTAICHNLYKKHWLSTTVCLMLLFFFHNYKEDISKCILRHTTKLTLGFGPTTLPITRLTRWTLERSLSLTLRSVS